MDDEVEKEDQRQKMFRVMLKTLFHHPETKYEFLDFYRKHYRSNHADNYANINELYETIIKNYCLEEDEQSFDFLESLIDTLIKPKQYIDDELFKNYLDKLVTDYPDEMEKQFVIDFLKSVEMIFYELHVWARDISEKCTEISYLNNQRKLADELKMRPVMLKDFINGSPDFKSKIIASPQADYEFRESLIRYILKNASAKTIEKLQKACKLIFNLLLYAVCQKIIYHENDNIEFVNKKSVFIIPGSDLLKDKQSLVITECFECACDTNFNTVLSKIYKCNITNLKLSNLTISYAGYILLTESGNIKNLIFDLAIVTVDGSESGEKVPLEDLVAHIPNASEIDIHLCHVGPNTMPKLLALSRKQNLSVFNLTFVDGLIDFDPYIEFIKQNFAPNANFDLTFNLPEDVLKGQDPHGTRRYQRGWISSFEEALQVQLKSWDPEKEKPNFRRFLTTNGNHHHSDDSDSDYSAPSDADDDDNYGDEIE